MWRNLVLSVKDIIDMWRNLALSVADIIGMWRNLALSVADIIGMWRNLVLSVADIIGIWRKLVLSVQSTPHRMPFRTMQSQFRKVFDISQTAQYRQIRDSLLSVNITLEPLRFSAI
jgi:hypothetical protein